MKTLDIFKCSQCGDCCNGYGGTFINEEDITRIAEYIGTDPLKFKKEYCRHSGKKIVIRQSETGFCIFWDKICTIHPVKPRMCKNWPFIESLLIDITNWQIMASLCPGIRTDIPDHLVREIVKREIANRGNE